MNLLRVVPMWVWIMLVALAAGGAGWLHLQSVSAQRDAARAQLSEARANVEALESALQWRRENAKRLNGILSRREVELSAARETIREHRNALARLEAEDDETAEWAGDDVPEPVAGWVQHLAGEDRDGARAGDAADPAQPDRPDPRAPGEGEP